MNPLTQVKRTQQINLKEASLGISEEASWHSKYKDSAYVFVGGIPFDLTEGDLLAVFSQYGEVMDVNLVRDKSTGKSRGFAFLAYEDQRSTILAVDNLNGAKLLGRIVRVDHVANYKKKEEEQEDEEERNRKREARGVCRAFQRGDCSRGDACKFSHDEQRNANTGWGSRDADSKWGPPTSVNPQKSHGRTQDFPSHVPRKTREEEKLKLPGKDDRLSSDEDHSEKIRSKRMRNSTHDHRQQGKDKSLEGFDKVSSRHQPDKGREISGRHYARERNEERSDIKKTEKQAMHDSDRYPSSRLFKEDDRERKRKTSR